MSEPSSENSEEEIMQARVILSSSTPFNKNILNIKKINSLNENK